MRTINLPGTDIVAPQVVLGLMRITEKTDDEIRELYAAARAVGVNFFDHAAIYAYWNPKGGMHFCEGRFGETLALGSAERAAITIQTKCGIAPFGEFFDFSHQEIIGSVNRSLKALRTDYLDVLLLHRPDALMEPDEVAQAFDELYASGKVLAFGVSNFGPGQIKLLQRSLTRPLVVNQIQLSIGHANAVAQGLAVNINGSDQAIDRDNGVVDYCNYHGIVLQAWSPFQAKIVPGTLVDNPELPELAATLNRLAEKYRVTPDAIVVAWILRHPANWQVVLGTTTPARVTAAAAGADITLSRAEWYELFKAAGHLVP